MGGCPFARAPSVEWEKAALVEAYYCKAWIFKLSKGFGSPGSLGSIFRLVESGSLAGHPLTVQSG